jgi:hypothetical protein
MGTYVVLTRIVSCLGLLLVGCASAPTTTSWSAETDDPGEPGRPARVDATEVRSKAAAARAENRGPALKYAWCASIVQTKTDDPRLFERSCVDSSGARTLLDYWDRDLQIFCRFRRATDGVMRCLPENEQSSPAYADGACQDPLALAPDGGPPYLGIVEGGAEPVLRVYAQGARAHADPVYYAIFEDGRWECKLTHMHVTGLAFYTLGAELDPALFAQR